MKVVLKNDTKQLLYIERLHLNNFFQSMFNISIAVYSVSGNKEDNEITFTDNLDNNAAAKDNNPAAIEDNVAA